MPWGADKAFGSIVSEAAVAGVPGYRKARAAFLLFVVDVISGEVFANAFEKGTGNSMGVTAAAMQATRQSDVSQALQVS